MLPRGRKPQPALEVIEGGFTLPEPPAFLDDYALAFWHKRAPMLAENGLLKPWQGEAFAAVCSAYGRWQRCEELVSKAREEDPATAGIVIETRTKNKIQSPLVGAANAARQEFFKHYVEFGGTPSGMIRLSREDGRHKDKISKKYFD